MNELKKYYIGAKATDFYKLDRAITKLNATYRGKKTRYDLNHNYKYVEFRRRRALVRLAKTQKRRIENAIIQADLRSQRNPFFNYLRHRRSNAIINNRMRRNTEPVYWNKWKEQYQKKKLDREWKVIFDDYMKNK